MTTTITVQITESDLKLLKRLAKASTRRFNDMLQLIFADGLDMFFAERHVMLERDDSEIPEDELKQIELNDKLRHEDGFFQLSLDERIAKGFEPHVSRWISNNEGDCGECRDPLIDPLAKRIRSFALD